PILNFDVPISRRLTQLRQTDLSSAAYGSSLNFPNNCPNESAASLSTVRNFGRRFILVEASSPLSILQLTPGKSARRFSNTPP
ncbi:MAG TPA: hypothetical protein VEW46_05925, partial [Pyrinomonadaceae bacterium]|nr:hypothetical protein [Pyrinomonadaceae bacterium]